PAAADQTLARSPSVRATRRTAFASVPRLISHPHFAPPVRRHGDDILAPVGIELLPGNVLARDAEVAAPPASVEPRLDQFDLDRLRLGVGEGVAHCRTPEVDRAV